ncbi:hypothetical protein HZZ00_37935 (plasmid) [Streptomyces sp. NEAU-sy36]|uniref:hypothetical protein n=1 Tax=unclassified Streptomyces TaxID=2593676 RepID=UPI0015D61ACE|nr:MULTISPECIES: hypothetical protein [unclassified Streptomyces]QLJ06812.1 hypothetical protein HZZ00_37935 [Streptomyces sp. NEAU-sy36]
MNQTDPTADRLAELRAEYASTGRVISDGVVWLFSQVVALREEVARLRAAPPAVVSPPPSRAALRDRIAEALRPGSRDRSGQYPEGLMRDVDAVLAVLPEPADRAAVLEEAADKMLALRDSLITAPDATGKYLAGIERAETELRRLAVEARSGAQQQPDTEVRTPCSAPPCRYDIHAADDIPCDAHDERREDDGQQAAAADGEETLCRCGHGRAYHDAKYADPQCRLCPEDGERSWYHPFTPRP